MSVLSTQTGLTRHVRASHMHATCVITPLLPPGQTATPVTTRCAVSLPASVFRGGVGERIGYGGGERPMDQMSDVQISFPYGTPIDTGDNILCLDLGLTYTAGQKRKALSNDFDVTVFAVEVGS